MSTWPPAKLCVATDLPTVREFNERHQILTTTAATPEQFLQAIESELPLAHDVRLRQKRREVAARSQIGQNRLEEMSSFIEAKSDIGQP